MRKLLVGSLLLWALVASAEAQSQGGPRRERGEGARSELPKRERDARPATPAAPQDPFAALEREMPSLKVDLLLTAGQVEAWSAFERDVRDLSELDRTRRRQIIAMQNREATTPNAREWIASLLDQDRRRAETMGELRRHLDAIYEKLDEKQRSMLDRRVVLSQTEPLGR
jgi:hypothetical protein